MDTLDVHALPHGLKSLYYYSIYAVTCMSAYCSDLDLCTCIQSNFDNQHNRYTKVFHHCCVMCAYKVFTWALFFLILVSDWLERC